MYIIEDMNYRNKLPETIETIVGRYNESIADVVEYKRAIVAGDKALAEKALRHAGESMSECLEFAVRKHLYEHDKERYKYMSNSWAPEIIKTAYCERGAIKDTGLDTLSGEPTTVDFQFLMTNKNPLINLAKHGGGVVDLNVWVGYKREMKKFILEYLDDNADLKTEDFYNQPEFDMIQQLYTACEKFHKEERRFILIADKVDNLFFFRYFSRVKWDLIIELNSHSITNGLCSIAYNGNTPAHIFTTADVVTDETIPVYSESPVLYFANGYGKVPPAKDSHDWNKNYCAKLEKFSKHFAHTIPAQEIIVLSITQDKTRLRMMMDMLTRCFDIVRFVITNDKDKKLEYLCEMDEYADVMHIPASMSEIDSCFNEYLVSNRASSECADYKLPCLKGEVTGIVTKNQMKLFEEFFEVLYEGVDAGSDGVKENFLSGAEPLTWEGAKRAFAAERPGAKRHYYKTVEDAAKNGRGELMIVHEPGFGGTTVARQIAYKLHEDYPVLFMKRYNMVKSVELLEMVHNLTKKTIIVFMEVPSVISQEDMHNLLSHTNHTRPYLFIGVKRGTSKAAAGSIAVTDWSNDVVLLRDWYLEYINAYDGESKKRKLDEINLIMRGDNVEPFKRTPFYFGMLAFEKNFHAIHKFLEQFVEAVRYNEVQRKVLIYIAITDLYIDRGLPDSFLRCVFNVPQSAHIFRLEEYFSSEDGIVGSLLTTRVIDGIKYRRIKYPYFTRELLSLLLNNGNVDAETSGNGLLNLGTYCKFLIEDVARSINADMMQDYVLKELFIGSSRERVDQKFTDIIDDIQHEDKVNIFKLLHDSFPENPHFASHLARYYSIVEKNNDEALLYADKALSLSTHPDPLLHHIKAMCLSRMVTNKISDIYKNMKRGIRPSEDEVDNIVFRIFPSAEEQFAICRQINKEKNHSDEYGFIPNVHLLLNIFDFYIKVNGKDKSRVISEAESPYMDWIDKAQALMEDVKNLYIEGEESERYITAETQLWTEYENLGNLIMNLGNKIGKTKHPEIIRRQLARIYIHRDSQYRENTKINNRVLDLMEQNIISEPRNEHNFYLWVSAARYSHLSNDELLSKITQWKALNGSVEITFYCYIINVLKAFDGSTEAQLKALALEKECRAFRTNDVRVREWYGKESHELVSSKDYRDNPAHYELHKVTGLVTEYNHQGAAKITADIGVEVYFNPSKNKLNDSCMNHHVQFCLGFSYDGMRAQDGSVFVID